MVVTPGEAKAIAEALLSKARDGDVVAARELLDRTVGKPSQTDLLERIQRLEEQLEAEVERWN